MKISASILSIKDDVKSRVNILDSLDIDYLHLDIMDGIFVTNKTWEIDEIRKLLVGTKKPKDVHLMVHDIKKYIDDFALLNPDFLTFHYEAVINPYEIINYIKSKGLRVGMSIKPNTSVSKIYDYLALIDLVLVMSVEPGKGGQQFIPSVLVKLDELDKIRKKENLKFVIEIDGGINDKNIASCSKADMVVIGNYITSSDNYEERIKHVKSI